LNSLAVLTITIDTDKQSIDESVKTVVNFIIPKITEVNKK